MFEPVLVPTKIRLPVRICFATSADLLLQWRSFVDGQKIQNAERTTEVECDLNEG